MNRNTGINVGGSSILMIFVLLCLTTFSTLSLASANADYKLTAKTVESVSRYYEADAQAETILAAIDASLKKSVVASDGTGQDMSTYWERIAAELVGLEGVTVTAVSDKTVVGYQVMIDDKRALRVALEVAYPFQNAEKRYTLTSWQVVQTGTWEADDTLNLWDGGEPLTLWSGELK
ncbi:hypothetical protein V6615_00550 [Oscillospiraceae bacterium PP1C4]